MRRFAAAIAIAVLVAACGGTTAESDGNEAASAEGTPTTVQETTEAPGEVSADDIDLGEDGELSLDDFIPGMQTGPMDESDFRAEEMAIQQQVAECMAAEGFEYIPFVPSDVGGGFGFEEEDQGEWVKKYGFGISTFVLMEEEMRYDEESDPWADDPNQEIVEAMDEVEQEEYFRLLHGGEPPIIEETPWEEIEAMSPEEQEAFFDEAYRDWEPTGCMNEAYEEAYGGDHVMKPIWRSGKNSVKTSKSSGRGQMLIPASSKPRRAGRHAWPKRAMTSQTKKRCIRTSSEQRSVANMWRESFRPG